jgi:hypothetical protein
VVRRKDVSLTWERRNPVSTIVVTLEPSPNGNRVKADPNPLSITPGDNTVTFDLGGNALEVAFERVLDLSNSGAILEPWGPFGPFDSLSIQGGTIVGTLRQSLPSNSRYLYKVVENGRALDWVNPVNDRILGGGIDIPPRPPGGGGSAPAAAPGE